MNQDFKDMLRLLEEHGVDYLVVGGYAVIRYSQPRYTKDLDIWIRPSKDNAAKMAKALRAFGVPLIEVTEEDFAEDGLQFMIGIHPNAIDFLPPSKVLISTKRGNQEKFSRHRPETSIICHQPTSSSPSELWAEIKTWPTSRKFSGYIPRPNHPPKRSLP